MSTVRLGEKFWHLRVGIVANLRFIDVVTTWAVSEHTSKYLGLVLDAHRLALRLYDL